MGNYINPDRADSEKHVLPKHLGGGPMGLGDPDDRKLRRVERDIIILNMVRERVRHEKCKEVGDILDKCGGEATWTVSWACRKERDDLMECSKQWFHDEGLRQECTEEFLRQRSYYRRTGKPGHLYKEEVNQPLQNATL